jgi:epoxide hydrolase-like predicted phosphatase
MSIRAVISDLGGVLVRTHDHEPRTRWEKRLHLTPGQLERLVFRGEAGQKAALGQIGPDDLWTSVIARLKLDPAERQALEADFWAGDRVDSALVDYLRGLRPTLKTGLLSNAWTGLRRALETQWGIADVFDVIVISAEVGLVKPDPAIYHLALSQLGVAPEEAIFLDDVQENIDAARFVGMHAVLFWDTRQAMSDIGDLMASPPPAS